MAFLLEAKTGEKQTQKDVRKPRAPEVPATEDEAKRLKNMALFERMVQNKPTNGTAPRVAALFPVNLTSGSIGAR